MSASFVRSPSEGYSQQSENLEDLLDSLSRNAESISSETAQERESSFPPSHEEQSAMFEKGISLMQAKNYSSALDLFDSCLDAQPDNPYLLFYRAQTLYSMQRYQESVDDLRRCAEEHPQFSDDYNKSAANFYMSLFTRLLQQEPDDEDLGASHSSVSATEAEDDGDFRRKAKKNYFAALGTSAKAAPLVLRGMAAFYSGQLELAVQDFSQAIAVDPKCFQAYFMRGSCSQRQRDYGPALLDFFWCLELDPSAPRVFFNIGLCYCRLGQPAKGVEFFTRSIMVLPDDPSAYNNRGAAFRDLNDPAKAVADFSVAIKLDPSYPNAWANRGLCYYQLKDFPKALADYTQSITLEPSEQRYHLRALVHAEMHQPDEAVADLSSALTLNPRDALSWYVRGNIHRGLNSIDKALEDYAKAVSLPWANRSSAFFRRGLLHKDITKNYTKAYEDFLCALQTSPKSSTLCLTTSHGFL